MDLFKLNNSNRSLIAVLLNRAHIPVPLNELEDQDDETTLPTMSGGLTPEGPPHFASSPLEGRRQAHSSSLEDTDVAHALLRAASTLVSMSAKRRDESRLGRQECLRHVSVFITFGGPRAHGHAVGDTGVEPVPKHSCERRPRFPTLCWQECGHGSTSACATSASSALLVGRRLRRGRGPVTVLRSGKQERQIGDDLQVVIRRWIQEKPGGPFGLFGFEQTSSGTCPPLDTHCRCTLTHAVSHPGPMMCLERIQRPIRVGHHSNPSLSADQDGHFRRRIAGS